MPLNYGLTDILDRSTKYQGIRSDAFKTLYYMYGGKKGEDLFSLNVPFDLCWYLSVLHRMDAFNKEARKKRMNVSKELERLEKEYASDEMIQRFKGEQSVAIRTYYRNMGFMASLFALKNYFDLNYTILSDKKDTSKIEYVVYAGEDINNTSFKVEGVVYLGLNMVDASIHQQLGKIYAALSRVFGRNVSEPDVKFIMNEVGHYICNSNFNIANFYYPNPHRKIKLM